MDIKQNLSENLINLRKSLSLTQAELAEKLNYSDKAVSKWERGESTPDLTVLKQIADFYGVTIDFLISEHPKKQKNSIKNLSKKRIIIALFSAILVWLVAICAYSFITLLFPGIIHTWLSFIYAIPITFLILLILTAIWGKSLTNLIITSLLVWTVLLSVYLTLLYALANPPITLWVIFLIGIPLQVLTVLLFSYNKIK
ncbi:MAG: helix-turn-helix domain-containing protein [Clostridia bacterium]|nr:helix-turn-helix domain-containing protein [Clostridia bacterium]